MKFQGEIRCFAYGEKKSCCCSPSESCAMGLALPRGLDLALSPSLVAQPPWDESQEAAHGASSVPGSLPSPLSLRRFGHRHAPLRSPCISGGLISSSWHPCQISFYPSVVSKPPLSLFCLISVSFLSVVLSVPASLYICPSICFGVPEAGSCRYLLAGARAAACWLWERDRVPEAALEEQKFLHGLPEQKICCYICFFPYDKKVGLLASVSLRPQPELVSRWGEVTSSRGGTWQEPSMLGGGLKLGFSVGILGNKLSFVPGWFGRVEILKSSWEGRLARWHHPV